MSEGKQTAGSGALAWECGPHANAWKGHDARCRQVPAPPLGEYRCNACGKVVTRASEKRWIKSMCDDTGRDSRLWRVVSRPGADS